MAIGRWARHRARRAVRRASRFDIRLPSRCPGIAFTARITATVITEPPYPVPVGEVAGAVRKALREAALEFAEECDPADVASALDACGQHLGRRRSLATDPPVEFEASLTMGLLPDDQAAVVALLTAQRRQAVTDALRRQRTQALAGELADPAAVLTRWIEQDYSDWSNLPSTQDVQAIAEAFAQYRPERERAVEYEALEVLREFFGSFPDLPQKQMLYTLLASGMQHADRPEHAAKAAALLNGRLPSGPGSGA